MNRVKIIAPLFVAVCCIFLVACGPSAEEVAKENARIQEEITQLKEAIRKADRGKHQSEGFSGPKSRLRILESTLKSAKNILTHDEEKWNKENCANGLGKDPQWCKHLKDAIEEDKKDIAKTEQDIANCKVELTGAQKAEETAKVEYDRLVKKLKDEYGIEYNPRSKG